MSKRLIFLLIAVAFFSWNGAKAQEADKISDKIQHIWAFPDCGDYDETLVFTRHFALDADRNGLQLTRYVLSKDGNDYKALNWGKHIAPVRIENDGILKLGTPAKTGPQHPKKWDDLIFDDKKEYSACAAMPTLVPRAMQRLLRYLDRIQEECTLKIDNDCGRVLFKLGDENSDSKLTDVEIIKGVTSALLLAALANGDKLTDKDLTAIAARARDDGAKIAADLLGRFDSDHSGSLDYNELVKNFSAPRLPVVKETLQKTGKLLPAFGIAAATLR